MMQNFGVVCMYNAARSPLLEALAVRLFPDFNFFSAGVVAIEDKDLPKVTKDFAFRLGLSHIKLISQNVLEVNEEYANTDLILASDDVVSQVLSRIYPAKENISIQNFAMHKDIRLKDPLELSNEEFDYQIGKFLCCGVSYLKTLLEHQDLYPINALIAYKSNLRSEAKNLFEKYYELYCPPLVIDCDFKFAANSSNLDFISGDNQIWIEGRDLIRINPIELAEVSSVCHRFEMSAWENFVTSFEWQSWLREMASLRPIILVCAPIDQVAGKRQNSFLSAVMAQEVIFKPNLLP